MLGTPPLPPEQRLCPGTCGVAGTCISASTDVLRTEDFITWGRECGACSQVRLDSFQLTALGEIVLVFSSSVT